MHRMLLAGFTFATLAVPPLVGCGVDESCGYEQICVPDGGGLDVRSDVVRSFDAAAEAGADSSNVLTAEADSEMHLDAGTIDIGTRDAGFDQDTGTCQDGSCAEASCTNACPSGLSRCGSGSVQTCDLQSSGCYAWSILSECPSNGCCIGNSCAPMPIWYRDVDGDGYGDPTTSMSACTQPAGYVANNEDCCDADPVVNPGYFVAHSSNPWQVVPIGQLPLTFAGACAARGTFLWNCEQSGIPVKEFTSLTLCDANFCTGACPTGCVGYSVANPGCGQNFIQQSAMCGMSSGTCSLVSLMSADSLQQGCY